MKQRVFPVTVAMAALLASLGVTACGAAYTTTTPPSHTPAATPTGTPSTTDSIKGIPFYKPATVRTKTDASATLTSPDSVRTVSDYYVKAVDTGGWTTVSKSMSAYHGHLTVKKSSQGATISVAPSGSGSLISISAYPTG
jgi:hypothetical protein